MRNHVENNAAVTGRDDFATVLAGLSRRRLAARHARRCARWALGRLLDVEIQRLPPGEQGPVLYCDLGGRSIREAAEFLGCSPRLVRYGLARGRRRLRRRLRQHGFHLSVASLRRLLGGNDVPCVPEELVQATVAAVGVQAPVRPAGGLGGVLGFVCRTWRKLRF